MHLFDCHEELNMKRMRCCGYHFSLKPAAGVLKCKPDQNQYKPWGFNLYTERTSLFWKRALKKTWEETYTSIIWFFTSPVS